MERFLLQTAQLSKRYGKHYAVNRVEMKVRERTIYGLLGPNGAGKSTILKLIAGLIRPTEGEILFEGRPWKRSDLGRIGALIESPALYGNLTARENLKVHTTLLGLPDQRIDEVLEVVDLTDTGKKKVSRFSLGMKQRLGIAIALLKTPKLLILDEPTNGLDPIGIQELRRLIRAFPEQGMTVILSSHVLSEVEQIADDIGIISEGKLLHQEKIRPGDDLESVFFEVVGRGKDGGRRHA
jgi:ABC-2 type transport system ATP-binding protein